MRVTIIGATGHIGSWLIPRLVRRGYEVVAISRGVREPYHQSAEWRLAEHVTLDRAAAERDGSFASAIADTEPDAVVDLICFTCDSAAQLVDALRGRIQHFVHCGTLWVHGVPRSRPYSEDAPREPFGEYGVHKAEIEAYLMKESASGFPATVLHPGHITGPGWIPINPAGNLDPEIFSRLASGDRVALPDDGLATLQHVHADDVAQAFDLALEKPDAAIGESFHVAAAAPVTLLAYARGVASWFGLKANLSFFPLVEWQQMVSGHDAALTIDHVTHSPHASIAKSQRLLGFNPRYDCESAVRDALGLNQEVPRTA